MKYEFYWPVLWQYRDLLVQGLKITIFLFLVSTIAALVVGALFGILGAGKSRILRFVSEVFVEFNRNTPMVVKLFFLYFGFGLDAYVAAIVGLTLHQSAYMAEVIRAGIQSVPPGQMSAAQSTGLNRIQALRHVVLPQALVLVIPPLTTQIIETLKNSSIAMTIAIPELTFQTQEIETLTFRGFEAATAATLIYLMIGLVVSVGAIVLERWLSRRLHVAETAKPQISTAS